MSSSAAAPLLTLERVTAGYRATEDVVHEVSLELRRGEVAAVVSLDMSGGKTTLLKAAAGLLEPRSGRVVFEGQDVYRMGYSADQRFRERCGVVLEGGALLANRTVWENVALPLRYHRGLWSRELNVAVERLLAQCGYNEDVHGYPWQISARGKRMAAFARALARDPDLVVVDRFFEGLEMPDWRRLFELVLEQNHNEGVSWLLVSELDPAIFQVAERVAVLEAGELLAYGGRRELFRDARLRAAFEAAELRPRRNPDSERILIVDSSDELDPLASAASRSELRADTPSPPSADAAELFETITIDGIMPPPDPVRPRSVHRPDPGARDATRERPARPVDDGVETINLSSAELGDLDDEAGEGEEG